MNEGMLDILRRHPDGADHVRLLHLLNERPQSDYQLASALDLDHQAVQHQLSALLDVDLVQSSSKPSGNIYRLTDHARHEWNTIETIIHSSDIEQKIWNHSIGWVIC